MKNCPMFSLRSNSIESRFARFQGQFLANTYVKLRKSKSNSEFASLMSFFTRYARSKIND